MKLALYRTFLRDKPYQYSMPPLGLGYLAAYVKPRCWYCEVRFFPDPEEIFAWKPDIVGISSATENFCDAMNLAGRLREEIGAKVLIGGAHITTLPHTLPDCMDIGIIGEGEETLTELIRFYNDKPPAPSDLRNIKGICFHENGRVVITKPRELIADLDTLPMPDREMLGENWAIPFSAESHLITSRGCPYDCTFCSAPAQWKKVRFFSAEYVIREIEHIRKTYNPEEIFFFDDLFIGHQPRFREICRIMKERGLHEGVVFRTYARANLIDNEMADLLAEMNFRYVDFGFESNSRPVLEYLNKQGVSPEINQRAIDLISARGLSIGGNFIIGSPHETREQMEETLEFIRKNKAMLDRCSVGPLQAPPGTRVWHYAKSRGLVRDDMDWSRYIVDFDNMDMTRDPYLCETMPVEEFTALYYEFHRLATEINLRGEIRKMGDKLERSRSRERALRSRLEALTGSRLVRLAMKLKRG